MLIFGIGNSTLFALDHRNLESRSWHIGCDCKRWSCRYWANRSIWLSWRGPRHNQMESLLKPSFQYLWPSSTISCCFGGWTFSCGGFLEDVEIDCATRLEQHTDTAWLWATRISCHRRVCWTCWQTAIFHPKQPYLHEEWDAPAKYDFAIREWSVLVMTFRSRFTWLDYRYKMIQTIYYKLVCYAGLTELWVTVCVQKRLYSARLCKSHMVMVMAFCMLLHCSVQPGTL